MIPLKERDVVILQSGLRALIVDIASAQTVFSVYVLSTGETKDVARRDIKSIIQYDEMSVK